MSPKPATQTLHCQRCKSPRLCLVHDNDMTRRACTTCGWRSVGLRESDAKEAAGKEPAQLADFDDARCVFVTLAHASEDPDKMSALARDVEVRILNEGGRGVWWVIRKAGREHG